jgi:dTDP-4-dehydrorhamnose reductase
MLGSDLEQEILNAGHKVVGFNRSNLDLSRSSSEIALEISSHGEFDVIVNAVAYTAVDKAESEPNQAMLVNGECAGKLVVASKELGSRFVHISTDYVFDGKSASPYKPENKTSPQSAYGRSKLAGEVAVQESGADYQIFRTAWLYGANGPCFPKTVKAVVGQAGSIKVVADQIGQPTWTVDLARLVIAHSTLEQSARPRIVHGTASGQASWADFASVIVKSLGYDPKKVVQPITTTDYSTPTKRPAYSVLDNQNETALVIGDWRGRWQEAAGLVLGE